MPVGVTFTPRDWSLESLVACGTRYGIEFSWKGDVDGHDACEYFDSEDYVNESSYGCDAISERDSRECQVLRGYVMVTRVLTTQPVDTLWPVLLVAPSVLFSVMN